jgi:hypothetical protein
MYAIETWRCNKCGHEEQEEIAEEGDGVVGEWMCCYPLKIGRPMCSGSMAMINREVCK